MADSQNIRVFTSALRLDKPEAKQQLPVVAVDPDHDPCGRPGLPRTEEGP